MRDRKSILTTLLLLGVSALSGCNITRIDGVRAGFQGGVEDAVSGIIGTLVDAAISPLLPAE